MKKIAHKIRHPHSVEYETAPKQARLDSRGHGVAPEGLVEGAGQVAVAAPEREGSFVMGNVTHVKVSVLQARNLLQADRFGLSDPYVQLELGDQKVQTRVVFDTCHPYWKQDFVLSLPADARTLQCGVWDYDRPPSAPDFLGSVAVDLNKLLQTSESAGTALATEPQWYALSKPQKHGQAQGELRMAVRLLHNSELETEQVVLPPRQYEQYTLEAKVIGTRGLVSTLNTGIHKGLSAAVFVGAFQAKTSRTMSGSPSEEDGIELFWDEEFEVPMDTALAAKEHTGLVRSMTHHFTEQAYDQLKKQAALEEVRFTLKRFRGRRGPTGRSSDIVGTAVFPLCAVPEVSAMADDNDDTASVVTMSDTPRAAQDEAPEEPETPELQEKSIVETISKAATSLPHTISSNVLQPLAGVLHLKLAENGAESAAKDELKAEGSGTSAASVEAKAEASAAGGKVRIGGFVRSVPGH
ncbi:hypothetical protein WJX72_008268 [[Myrmecia] bisecta]|uniref:C2 domain-containing protein n=1 Tax=[Myrmecia] bisecta TaxID=41462 RepID=A0AAW1PTJ3_9CHLO